MLRGTNNTYPLSSLTDKLSPLLPLHSLHSLINIWLATNPVINLITYLLSISFFHHSLYILHLHCNRIPFGSYFGFALIGRHYIWGFLGFGFGLVWFGLFMILVLVPSELMLVTGLDGWMALVIGCDTPTETFLRTFLCLADELLVDEKMDGWLPYNLQSKNCLLRSSP